MKQRFLHWKHVYKSDALFVVFEYALQCLV